MIKIWKNITLENTIKTKSFNIVLCDLLNDGNDNEQ